MKIELELTEEDLIVLKAADRAFVQDIDDNHMKPEDAGWRMTDELYPEQCRVYQWNKLVWLRLLETEGDGYYRITEQGRQVLYPPQPEPDELMVLRTEVARLREALEPFANVVVPRGLHGFLRIWDGRGTYPMLMLTTDHLEAARKALESVRRTKGD